MATASQKKALQAAAARRASKLASDDKRPSFDKTFSRFGHKAPSKRKWNTMTSNDAQDYSSKTINAYDRAHRQVDNEDYQKNLNQRRKVAGKNFGNGKKF